MRRRPRHRHTPHLLAGALGLAVVLALASTAGPAAAQALPADLLEDASTFRGVLRNPVGNVLVVDTGASQPARLRVLSGGIELDGGSSPARSVIAGSAAGGSATGAFGVWAPGDESLPLHLRMLGAAMGSGDLTAAFAALGFRLDATSLGHEVTETGVVVQRLGGQYASLTVEPGIARPRQLRIESGNVAYVVDLLEYGEVGRQWYPTRVRARVDGRVALEIEVVDLARSTDDLAPVRSTVAPARPPARFPRVPL